MANVFAYVERVKYNKRISEGSLACVFAEYDFVATEIVLVRFEADTIKVEEATQVTAERFLFVGVESVEVC